MKGIAMQDGFKIMIDLNINKTRRTEDSILLKA
jgi:hypothetical protein